MIVATPEGSCNWRKLPLLPLGEILPHVRPSTPGERRPKEDIRGDLVKVHSIRLLCFKEKGTRCCFCGVEGTHFAKERHLPEHPWHVNLYGFDAEGNEVQLTKDHKIPKSLGGPDSLENMQTACAPCNEAKGNTYDPG